MVVIFIDRPHSKYSIDTFEELITKNENIRYRDAIKELIFTEDYIPISSFYNLPNLEAITFKTDAKIDQFAFSICPKLKKMICDKTITIAQTAFIASGLEEIYINSYNDLNVIRQI